MNRQRLKTLAMMVVALVLAGAAFYWYPRTTVTESHASAGENLIPDFPTQDVRWIHFERFEPNTGAVRKFDLQFEDGQWTIPERAGFPAGNLGRITSLLNSMKNLKIHDVPSGDRKDHAVYGVLEPDSDSVTGKGFLIRLEDRNREPIASVIVGESPENSPEKRSVRIPGQPQIYVTDFDSRVLTTEFADWVDSRILRFDTEQPPREQLVYARINHYTIDPETLATGPELRKVYEARVEKRSGSWTARLAEENGAGDAGEESDDQVFSLANSQWFAEFESALASTRLVSIKPKQDLVANYLAAQNGEAKPIEFSSMVASGFKFDGFEDGHYRFLAMGGELEIVRPNGLKQTVYFGNLADVSQTAGEELPRYVFVVAAIDESLIPIPEKPDDDADEEASGEYQRELNRRQQTLDELQQLVDMMNRQYSQWYFLIPESQCRILLPEAETLKGS